MLPRLLRDRTRAGRGRDRRHRSRASRAKRRQLPEIPSAHGRRLRDGGRRGDRHARGGRRTLPGGAHRARLRRRDADSRDELLRAAGDAAKTKVDPLSDHRGSAAYKREMAAVMVARALARAWEAARSAR
ncbi:MAG: hypothetical protein DMD81_14485 [Candidatus Rokuibacteriota bacterium]|nr:MAG: hypothetical protein DMD81_14485 [Candidatus Rokubacteria bacterium]